MSDCKACGHSVVAWEPYLSFDEDDLVCYNCGLHENSEAAKRIAELEAECDGYMKNAAFFRSCALSGESPTDGSEPYSPPIDTGSEG